MFSCCVCISGLVEFFKDFLDLQLYVLCMHYSFISQGGRCNPNNEKECTRANSLSSSEIFQGGECFGPSCDVCMCFLVVSSGPQCCQLRNLYRETVPVRISFGFGPYCIASCDTCLQSQQNKILRV